MCSRGKNVSGRAGCVNVLQSSTFRIRKGTLRVFAASRSFWMCDYSLENVASRPATVGDRLVSKSFPYSITRGFAAVDDPMVAVCLAPGTELAFDKGVVYERAFPLLPSKKLPHCVARVRHL